MTALQPASPPGAICGQLIRRTILEQSLRANVGHIGSALSVADIIAALYGGLLNVPALDDPSRDRFVMSKGHAALALYAALYLRGWITAAELDTYCGDDTMLGVHPEHGVRGIDFSTGSLGHGLSYGVGSAIAARIQGSPRRTVVLLSDAECNEGSTWEAVMLAAHQKLTGLCAVIDANGQQALGYTRDVLDLSPLVDRWSAFGWEAIEIDGHDPASLREAFGGAHSVRPRAVVARTVFGRGVSFMESQLRWHYAPMTRAEYDRASEEVRSKLCEAHSSTH